MALNLVRNSRVFFTTNVDTNTGDVATSGHTDSTTREIQVLDGFTFTQNTTSETITLNESGATPNRGQRSFNTALEPAEVTMSTYIRPETATNVVCEESVLWNALATGKGGSDAWDEDTGSSVLSFATSSESHQLKAFGLIIVVDNVTYFVNNCVVDQAVVDFGIDAIATVAWTIRGSTIKQASSNLTISAPSSGIVTLTGAATGTAKGKDTDAAFIANKLSTISMAAGINGTTALDIPITGGSITFANNVTYLTPANLGTVNLPVTYFAGTRAISGSLTGYLRTGSGGNTGTILSNLLANSATEVAPAYKTVISIGGSSNANRVVIEMPAAVLTIPTVSVEQVVSTTINFTAHATASSAFDIEQANEATVTYYAAA